MTTPLEYRSPKDDFRPRVNVGASLLAGVLVACVGFACVVVFAKAIWIAGPIAGAAAGGLAARRSPGRATSASLIAGAVPVVCVMLFGMFAVQFVGTPLASVAAWRDIGRLVAISWAIFGLPAWIGGALAQRSKRTR